MLHRAWIECCNKIRKNFKMYWRSTPPGSSAILEKYKNYTRLAALKIPSEVFHITISAFNIKWAKWSQYQITDIDCGIVINFCIVYLAKSHNHLITTIKHNIIRKLFIKSKHGRMIEKEWQLISLFKASVIWQLHSFLWEKSKKNII